MIAKYLHNVDCLNHKRKSNDSPVWKNLLKCRNLGSQGVIWKLGNGENISFWYDDWIENKNLVDIIGIDEENIPNPPIKVCDFIHQDKGWDIPKLAQALNNHPIILKIQGISIPIHDTKDSFCWGLNNSDDFSTKSATRITQGTHLNDSSE